MEGNFCWSTKWWWRVCRNIRRHEGWMQQIWYSYHMIYLFYLYICLEHRTKKFLLFGIIRNSDKCCYSSSKSRWRRDFRCWKGICTRFLSFYSSCFFSVLNICIFLYNVQTPLDASSVPLSRWLNLTIYDFIWLVFVFPSVFIPSLQIPFWKYLACCVLA